MKFKIWVTITILMSAYAPLGLLLVILDFDFAKLSLGNPRVAFAVLGVSLVSVVVLWMVMARLRGEHFAEVLDVEHRSHEFLNYALPYISSFALGEVFGNLAHGLVVALFLVLLCVVSARAGIMLINPLLVFFGVGLYGVTIRMNGAESFRLVLARQSPVKGAKLKVSYLSPVMLFGESPTSNQYG
jgi:hypothetical protein